MTQTFAKLLFAIPLVLATSSCGLTSECLRCEQHTYIVLDSTTDHPIPDAEVHLMARGTFPGIGHPGSYTKAEWHRQTNSEGEFSIPERWADEASVIDLRKHGYMQVRVPQMITSGVLRTEHQRNLTVLYLTPESDIRMAEIQYRLKESQIGVASYKDTPTSFVEADSIAKNYLAARSIAKTDAERNAVRAFCPMTADFSELMDRQRRASRPVVPRKLPDGTIAYGVDPNGVVEIPRENIDKMLADCKEP